jgi:hypothetical protein
MRILQVEPGKRPVEREIDGTLATMQELVGGTIQAIYPFDDSVALICNDDGKFLGLPLNRALYDPDTHQLVDIVSGTFFLCGAPRDTPHYTSLTDQQVVEYRKQFAVPETFFRVNGQLLILRTQEVK